MTYRQLSNVLRSFNESALDRDVTVCDHHTDEFFPVTRLEITWEDDTLDIGHPYLVIE